MKKIFLWIFLFSIMIHGKAQEAHVDPGAVIILDRMSEIIGDLNSCSFTVHTSNEKFDPEKGYVKSFHKHEVYMAGPDKMHVLNEGSNGKTGYWYHGDLLLYYAVNTNQYGFIETPDNIIETIDFVYQEYDLEFPAADFFYPGFTDDLLETHERVTYEGLVNINGVEAHHIVAYGKETNVQIWVSNDTFALPIRYLIHDLATDKPLQFEGVFSNWALNPILPDAMFDFVVPESASRVSIISKSSTYSNISDQ
ncbi:MAG: DUF2092 domain-containing protein [Cecembia sp.]